MPGLIESHMPWFRDELTQEQGQTITYIAELGSASFKATLGQTTTQSITIDGAAREHRQQDFIFRASDLVINGIKVLPKRGDRVEWVDQNSVKRTFELSPKQGEPSFAWHDPEKLMIRIHTEQVIEEQQ